MQKHQDAGAGSNSTDANDLVRVELEAGARAAIGQEHEPRVAREEVALETDEPDQK
jgi:hypothetical protein